tara:strand:+ start:130 stop:366 length:237 start_codon:yes stop_codon:yes gene_type:complete
MTLKSTVDEILSKNKKAMFYGDPFDYTNEDIDEVIEYFENTEEYEKCGELLNEKIAKETAEFDIFLHNLAEANGITNH